MRIKAKFKSVRPDEVGAELVTHLREIYSDNRRREFSYCADIYVDDPRYEALQECLVRAGKRPRQPAEPFSHDNYWIELHREYEPSDFADCRYVEFQPHCVEKLTTDRSQSVTELNPDALRSGKESILCQGMCFGDYYASDETKRLLEAEGFVGLSFQPTRLRNWMDAAALGGQWVPGDEVAWEDFGPPWWEMVCERVMPSLSPSMTLVTFGKSPQIVHPPVADPNRGYDAREGLYTPVELHYRSSDIAKAEPFDYARNLEQLGNIAIIVSKRFYDFCQAHDLKADWVPVRIDPD